MERWSNRVAVITGCSSGIGLQTAKDLLKANVKVVGLDKRYDRLVEQRNLLSEPQKNNFHLKKCDVTSESEVDEVFDWIEKELGGTDILVNNAGCLIPGQIVDLPLEHLKCMIDTNMMGIIYCTRKAFKSMKSRDVAGHVININSIDGHQCVPGVFTKCSMNIYPVNEVFDCVNVIGSYSDDWFYCGVLPGVDHVFCSVSVYL
uniref:Uncharacterized protein n=1 Tax=Megaselia scalaris TaxID=36166 RepID=T1GR09_MEGSC